MDDLISRQEAIKAYQEFSCKGIDCNDCGSTDKDGNCVIETWFNSLPSAQPEQADCEYCHEDADGYVRPIEKNSHAWLVRRGRTMKLRVRFNGGYSECDILFCPMCGRRLIDG